MKGQLTIFFIVGLVLVIVFGLLAYVAIDSVETQEGVTSEARNYLSSCVENTVYSYLDSLATQNYYAILNPSVTSPEELGIDQSLDDIYGSIDSRYDDTTRSTLFGTRNLTPLCDPNGPNNRSQTQNLRCFIDSYGPQSHQEQLRESIKEDLIACARPNPSVDEELGTRISQWPDPEVTVTFGKSAVLIEATYERNGDEIYTLDLSYNARLLQLYSLIEERLVMTTKDPRITVTDLAHAQQSTYFREGFIMEMSPAGNDWSYSFTDTNSNYRGTQLTISFLGKDREPYTDTNVEIEDDENYPKYDPDTGIIQKTSGQLLAHCDGVAPKHLTRSTSCDKDNPESDCHSYVDIFGTVVHTEFPGSTNSRTFYQGPGEYAGLAFTFPDLSSTSTGKWSVSEVQSTPGVATGGHKMWTISDCPGDFDQDRISSHPFLGPGCYSKPTLPTSSILWGGESYVGNPSRCGLQPGKEYFLNIVYTTSPEGTDPNDIDQGCPSMTEAIGCGNTLVPIFNKG